MDMQKLAFEVGKSIGMQQAMEKAAGIQLGEKLKDYGVGIGLGGLTGAGFGAGGKFLKNLIFGESGGYTPWLLGGGLAGGTLGGLGTLNARNTLQAALNKEFEERIKRYGEDKELGAKIVETQKNKYGPWQTYAPGVITLLSKALDEDKQKRLTGNPAADYFNIFSALQRHTTPAGAPSFLTPEEREESWGGKKNK